MQNKMAAPYRFTMKQPLLDITVNALTAGSTHQTVTTGTSPASDTTGSSQVTQYGTQLSVPSTALGGLFADATDIFIYSPTAANETFPDVWIWPVVDGVDMANILSFDASLPGNMCPPISSTVGQRHVSLGVPYREAVAKGMRDLPLKATGLKYSRQLNFKITSAAGWATTDQPLRIVVYGDLLDAQSLQTVAAQGYSGAFSDSVSGYAGISLNHQLPGGLLTEKSWTALPGGNSQGQVKSFRFMRASYNAVATPPTGQFVLSNDDAVLGAQGHVTGEQFDLGFNFTNGGKYLRFTEFGVRPGTNNAMVGVRINDTTLPGARGAMVTPNTNLWPYGNVQPYRASSGEFFALSRMPFPVVASRNKVAFFIEGNGSAIAEGATSVAVGGVLVETGNAA